MTYKGKAWQAVWNELAEAGIMPDASAPGDEWTPHGDGITFGKQAAEAVDRLMRQPLTIQQIDALVDLIRAVHRAQYVR